MQIDDLRGEKLNMMHERIDLRNKENVYMDQHGCQMDKQALSST